MFPRFNLASWRSAKTSRLPGGKSFRSEVLGGVDEGGAYDAQADG
jgi:hypothetical protein